MRMKEKLTELGIEITDEWEVKNILHHTRYFTFNIKGIEWCVSECEHTYGENTYLLSNELKPNIYKYIGHSRRKCLNKIKELL